MGRPSPVQSMCGSPHRFWLRFCPSVLPKDFLDSRYPILASIILVTHYGPFHSEFFRSFNLPFPRVLRPLLLSPPMSFVPRRLIVPPCRFSLFQAIPGFFSLIGCPSLQRPRKPRVLALLSKGGWVSSLLSPGLLPLPFTPFVPLTYLVAVLLSHFPRIPETFFFFSLLP